MSSPSHQPARSETGQSTCIVTFQFRISHLLKYTLLATATWLILFNILAYRQAAAMMRFVDEGERTVKPEELTTAEKIGVLLTGITVPKPQNSQTPADVGLEFATVRFAAEAGVELEAWIIPHHASDGMVLVFHGYAVAKDTLLEEAAAFNQLGYTVMMVDFRGSGGSNQNYTTVGFAEARDVAAAVETFLMNNSQPPMNNPIPIIHHLLPITH
ncbi:MAG: alpha/beta hydrolase [Ardenticatenaceae bacterium]|nr:alpha/beta hydrolase [Ardenticatenaceae bacterium]